MVLLTGGTAGADWGFLGLEEMARDSDLIVIGKLNAQTNPLVLSTDEPRHYGIITLEQVVKGESKEEALLILLTPKRPNGLISSAEMDLQFPFQTRAVWFLQQGKGGAFLIKHPNRFVPEPRIAEALEVVGGLNPN